MSPAKFLQTLRASSRSRCDGKESEQEEGNANNSDLHRGFCCGVCGCVVVCQEVVVGCWVAFCSRAVVVFKGKNEKKKENTQNRKCQKRSGNSSVRKEERAHTRAGAGSNEREVREKLQREKRGSEGGVSEFLTRDVLTGHHSSFLSGVASSRRNVTTLSIPVYEIGPPFFQPVEQPPKNLKWKISANARQ